MKPWLLKLLTGCWREYNKKKRELRRTRHIAVGKTLARQDYTACDFEWAVQDILKILQRMRPIKFLGMDELGQLAHLVAARAASVPVDIEKNIAFVLRNPKLNADECLEVYDFLRALGLYSCALPFRSHALKLSCENRLGLELNGKKRVARHIAACLELNIFDSFEDYRTYVRKVIGRTCELLDSALLTGAIWFNDRRLLDKLVRDQSSEFAAYLASKSIAVVGPSRSAGSAAEQIDGFDVVIRLNQRDRLSHDLKKTKGLKTDVNYFNGEFGEFLVNNVSSAHFPPCDWYVFKGSITARRFEARSSRSCRAMFGSRPFVPFHGNLNLVPLILADLVINGCSTMHLFFVDLMLTIDRDDGYYPEAIDYSKDPKTVFNCDSHDPISQFVFVKKLFADQMLFGDERFEAVMKLTEEEYARGLEVGYSIF